MLKRVKAIVTRKLDRILSKKSALIVTSLSVFIISVGASTLHSYGEMTDVTVSTTKVSNTTYMEQKSQQELIEMTEATTEEVTAEVTEEVAKRQASYNATKSNYEELVEKYKKEAKEKEEARQEQDTIVASTTKNSITDTVYEETTEAPVIEEPVEPETTEVVDTKESESETADDNGYTYLGCYSLTAYCPCSICCGQWAGGPTTSGAMPSAGHTVACNSLALGTTIYIEGYGTYVVEDTGGMGHGVIDIFFNTHDEALAFGSGSANVYIVN